MSEAETGSVSTFGGPEPDRGTAAGGTVRAVLVVIGGVLVAQGILMSVAPGDFYELFANFGARNDHLLRDDATARLAVGGALALSAWRPSWRVPVLWTAALWYGLHAINHIADIGDAEPAWVGPFDLAVLALIAAICGLLAVRESRAKR